MRLRRRGAGDESSADATTSSPPLLRQMARVDMFPKPKEDFRRTQTAAGGIVSTITVAILLVLVAYETVGYAVGRDAHSTQLSVSNSRGKDMLVNIDIDFPKTPCHSLSVDVVDAAGTRRFNVTRSIYKMPLGYKGENVFQGDLPPFVQEREGAGSEDDHSAGLSAPSECLPCFRNSDKRKVGAGAKESCCDTCSDVMQAYTLAGLAPPPKERIRQCLGDLSKANPGCNIRGTVVMKKVDSALVFAPRQRGNGYLVQEVLRFASDHRIKKFTIGDERVQRFSQHTQASPLEGRVFSPRTHSAVRYFLQVVPTSYSAGGNPQLYSTYEYSARWSQRAIMLGMQGEIPLVAFVFEITPIQVNYSFARPPFLHFLVQLCGIVGGLFVVLGVMDSIVSWIVNAPTASV